MTRILIFTSHDNNLGLNESNLGVTALIITAIQSLRKQIPDAAFVTTGQFSKAFCRQYNLDVIKGKVFIYKVLALSETIKWLFRWLRSFVWTRMDRPEKGIGRWLVSDPLLKEIIQADLIILFIHDTFSDSSRILSIIDHIIELSTVFLLNRRVMIWNSSIGPLEKTCRSRIGRWLLNKASIITLRENKSLAYLKSSGLDAHKLYLFPDTVFLLKPAPKSRIEDIFSKEHIRFMVKPVIGVCIGRELPLKEQHQGSPVQRMIRNIYRFFEYCLPDGLSFRIASFAGRIRSSSMDMIDKRKVLADVIDYCTRNLDATVLLISHIILPGEEDRIDMRDERIEARAVFEMVKNRENVKVIGGVYTTDEVKGIVGQCDVLVGMRMHICVASLSQCIPTLAITYNYKFYGMMEFAGQQEWICDTMAAADIISKLNDIWEKRDEVREALKEQIPKVLAGAHKHAAYAAELLKVEL